MLTYEWLNVVSSSSWIFVDQLVHSYPFNTLKFNALLCNDNEDIFNDFMHALEDSHDWHFATT